MKRTITTIVAAIAFGVSLVGAAPVAAHGIGVADSSVIFASPKSQAINGLKSTSANPDGEKKLTGTKGYLKDVTNILLFVIGAVSVIMLVIGGVKYTTSNGAEDRIKSAKNTILYALVGVIVAIAAYAIVAFVINAL